MSKNNPNQLVVEGQEDLFAVVGLMEHHIPWDDNDRPVHIYAAGSVDKLLDRPFLSTKIKQSGLKTLGLLIDADDVFEARWASIRDFFREHFKDIPDLLPENGLVVDNDEGIRCGIWIMPDNGQSGMIETFCRELIPNEAQDSWKYANSATGIAREKGANWRDVHKHKAQIHTWLAWQNPPGERMGVALKKKIFDVQSPGAELFVAWFKRLYEIE